MKDGLYDDGIDSYAPRSGSLYFKSASGAIAALPGLADQPSSFVKLRQNRKPQRNSPTTRT